MQRKIIRLLFASLFAFCFHCPLFANDPSPRPVTICSGANIIIKGDPLSVASTSYLWEFFQGTSWVSAPGVNTEQNYLASSLYNPTAINIIFTVRRKTIVSGLPGYDSYYYVTVRPIIPISNNVIVPPLITDFCSQGDPAAIVGAEATSGNATFIYQWQSSADDVTFVNIDGANARDYQPGKVTATTYLRRIAISDGCGMTSTSNTVKFTVSSALANNSIKSPAHTLFCADGDPAPITGDDPLGGNGTYIYQWQQSTDNVVFTDIKGATDPDYDPAPLSTTTYFRRSVISGPCSSALISNVITIQITPVLAVPELEKLKESICSGSSTSLSVKNPVAGISYHWYDSPARTKLLFVGETYITDALYADKTFYIASSNGTCSSASLAAAIVSVMPILRAPIVSVEATTQHSITFTWAAVDGATSYKVSVDGGLTFIYPSSGREGHTHQVEGLRGSESVSILVKASGSLDCQEGAHSAAVTGQTLTEFDDIFVPNAFTPNGDGRNDVVYVRSQTVRTLNFYVYSQWGEQIFYSPNIANGWDGTNRGSNQPVGVYVYTLKAIMNDGREVNKKGTITLIR